MRNLLWVMGLVFIAWLISKGSFMDSRGNKPLNYSKLVDKIRSNQVQEVEIDKAVARGRFKAVAGAQGNQFTAELPDDPISRGDLTKLLLEKQVNISYPKPFISENTQNIILTILVPI